MSSPNAKGYKKNLLTSYKTVILKMRDDGYSYTQINAYMNEQGVFVGVDTLRRFVISEK